MPLEESFSDYDSPPAHAAPAPALEVQPEPIAATAPTPEPEVPVTPVAETPTEPVTPVESTPVAVVETPPATEAPAFDEAAFFKNALGDDAPKSAAELKEQYQALRAKQITPEVEAQLAILSDPAKMAEFANISGKDYDKPTAVEIMREKFAVDHPDMPKGLLEREFSDQFAKRFPTIAQYVADPESVDADDPALKNEMEAADYYSKADRTFLKDNQQKATQQFIAATAAPKAPPLTPAQEADVEPLNKWLNESITDGAGLPVELADGTKFALPIQNAAQFKAAFNDSYRLLESHALNPDKTINRSNQAIITAFLQLGPTGFMQQVVQQARAAAPAPEPAIPLSVLANNTPVVPKADAPPARKTVYNEGHNYQNFNY